MKTFKKYAPMLAAVLGIIAVIMIFLPAVATGDDSFNGIKAVFGWTEKTEFLGSTIETKLLSFSFMNLLTYLLAIAGVVLSVLGIMGKGSKLFTLIATVCFAVAAVFFFCTIAFTVVEEGWSDLASALGGDIKESWKLGVGSIIGGICSILAAGCTIVPTFLK